MTKSESSVDDETESIELVAESSRKVFGLGDVGGLGKIEHLGAQNRLLVKQRME